MRLVPQPVLDSFEKLKTQEKHLELRQIKAHYYVYRQKCHWNKERKKPIKTTELLGSIAFDGTYTPKHQRNPFSTTKIYEYGNSQLCHALSSDLAEALKNLPYRDEFTSTLNYPSIRPSPHSISGVPMGKNIQLNENNS